MRESKIIKAVTWEKNPEVLRAGRELIQNLLENLCTELDGKQANPASLHKKDFHFEMITGELLSLYPYFRPGNGG